MFPFDLGKQVGAVFEKEVVLELEIVFVAAHLVEVVHVELGGRGGTCLTKEDMLECLKYCGRTSYSKALILWILKEHPPPP